MTGFEEGASYAATCEACPLHSGCRLPYGAGSLQPEVLVVLEVPAKDKALLDRMVNALGVSAYVTTLTKCDPGGELFREDAEECLAYLEHQIQELQPAVIMAMGRSAGVMLGMKSQGRWRGKLFQYGDIPVVTTYHPDFVVKIPEAYSKVGYDLGSVMKYLPEETS